LSASVSSWTSPVTDKNVKTVNTGNTQINDHEKHLPASLAPFLTNEAKANQRAVTTNAPTLAKQIARTMIENRLKCCRKTSCSMTAITWNSFKKRSLARSLSKIKYASFLHQERSGSSTSRKSSAVGLKNDPGFTSL